MPFDQVDLEYLEGVHTAAPSVLRVMETEGRRGRIPIVATAVARFLHVAIAARRPARVLEIGTAIGYSTAWMALALPPGGRITTIDPDSERTARARAFWRRLRVDGRIEVINAPALQVLPRLKNQFQACFIDAVKEEYGRYLEGVLRLMRPGAILMVDNLLWSGRVARPATGEESTTRALRAFNRRFLHDQRLAATILPVGDGVGYAVVRR
jgi:predicted O-methyltransferase YrrM